MVVQIPNDSYGALHGLPADEIEKINRQMEARERERLHRIRSEKDLGPYIVAIADRYLFVTGMDGIPSIFRAMAMRSDIPQADIQRYTQLAEKVLDDPTHLPHPTGEDLVVGIAPLLVAHPSEQGINILRKMLRTQDEDKATRFKMIAGKAVSEAGLSSLLPEMRAAAEWLHDIDAKYNDEYTKVYCQEFDGYIRKLEFLNADPQYQTLEASSPSAKRIVGKPAEAEAPVSDATYWAVWMAVGGAVTLVFIYFHKWK